MAINPIAANVVSPPPVATPATSSHAPASARQPVAPEQSPAPVAAQSPQDSVQLSGAALARSLKIAGQTPTQIAMKMGVDIKTVNSYLDTTPAATASASGTQQAAATPPPSGAEEANESSIQKAIEG